MNKILFVFFALLAFALPVFTQSKETRKFDEFSFDIICDVSKAKVDAFGIELVNNPDSSAYIVFYEGKIYPMPSGKVLPRRGEARARVNEFIEDYIARRLGQKVKVIDGGYREKYTIEFWVVPKEGSLPILAPTVKPEEIKFRKGKYHNKTGEGC